MQSSEAHLMTIRNALQVLPVSREALYRKLQSGELPSYRFGRKVLVDIQECLQTMRRTPAIPTDKDEQ